MQFYRLLLEQAGGLIFWSFFASVAALAMIALASPNTLMRLSARSSRWMDPGIALKWLDQRRFEVDPILMPYSRLLGGAALVTLTVLALRLAG